MPAPLILGILNFLLDFFNDPLIIQKCIVLSPGVCIVSVVSLALDFNFIPL
jgi:hypothetical protein